MQICYSSCCYYCCSSCCCYKLVFSDLGVSSKISFQFSSSQTFTSVLMGSVGFGFVRIHFVAFCFYKLQLSLNFFSIKFLYQPLFFKCFFSSLGFRFPHVWISNICNL
jgi:hypothetical protein